MKISCIELGFWFFWSCFHVRVRFWLWVVSLLPKQKIHTKSKENKIRKSHYVKMVKCCLRTSKMQKLQELFSKRQCNHRHTITNSLQHMKVFPTNQTNEQLETLIAWTISTDSPKEKLGLLLKTQNWVSHLLSNFSLSLSLPSTNSHRNHFWNPKPIANHNTQPLPK